MADEEISVSEELAYREARLKSIDTLRQEGIVQYPHKFQTTITFQEFHKKYEQVINHSIRKCKYFIIFIN